MDRIFWKPRSRLRSKTAPGVLPQWHNVHAESRAGRASPDRDACTPLNLQSLDNPFGRTSGAEKRKHFEDQQQPTVCVGGLAQARSRGRIQRRSRAPIPPSKPFRCPNKHQEGASDHQQQFVHLYVVEPVRAGSGQALELEFGPHHRLVSNTCVSITTCRQDGRLRMALGRWRSSTGYARAWGWPRYAPGPRSEPPSSSSVSDVRTSIGPGPCLCCQTSTISAVPRCSRGEHCILRCRCAAKCCVPLGAPRSTSRYEQQG
jgi:hypothetical protein